MTMRTWIAAMALAGTVLAGCGPTQDAAEPEAASGGESGALALCQLEDQTCEGMNGTACSMYYPRGFCCELTVTPPRQTCTCRKTKGDSGVWSCPIF